VADRAEAGEGVTSVAAFERFFYHTGFASGRDGRSKTATHVCATRHQQERFGYDKPTTSIDQGGGDREPVSVPCPRTLAAPGLIIVRLGWTRPEDLLVN